MTIKLKIVRAIIPIISSMSKWPVSEKVYQISHDPYDYEYQASKIWQGHPPEYKNLLLKIPAYVNKANC